MKNILLLLCLSFITLTSFAQSFTINGEYDKQNDIRFVLTSVKKYQYSTYYKEYTRNRVLLKDSNFDIIALRDGSSFKQYYIKLKHEFVNDSIVQFKICELNEPMYFPKFLMKPLVIGNKSGKIAPYTVLIKNTLDIKLSEEVVCGVVCQDYWDPVSKSYKKCDFNKNDYKKYSAHYYEICLRFFKDDNAVGKFVDLYEKH